MPFIIGLGLLKGIFSSKIIMVSDMVVAPEIVLFFKIHTKKKKKNK